jgi:hypothetical protein
VGILAKRKDELDDVDLAHMGLPEGHPTTTEGTQGSMAAREPPGGQWRSDKLATHVRSLTADC